MSKDVPLKALFKKYGNTLVSVAVGSFLTTLSVMPFVAAKAPVSDGVIGLAAVVAATGASILAVTAFAIKDRYYRNAPTCG